MHGVAPGSYILTLTTADPDAPVIQRQMVDVASADVNDIRIAASAPGSIRGQLRIGDGDRGDLNHFTVFLQSAENLREGMAAYDPGGQNFARVKPDGTFELKNVPAGNYRVEVQGATRDSRDYYLQKVIAGSREISDSSLRVGGGGSLTLDLVLSAGTGVVQGTVLDAKNQPVKQATVVALPEGQKRTRRDLYQLAETDQYGRFILRGLRPEQYTLISWDYVEEGAYFDPEFIKPYEPGGKVVQVASKQTQEVQLQVQSGSSE
jgi:carboxypeptidase family protein